MSFFCSTFAASKVKRNGTASVYKDIYFGDDAYRYQ